ncbi:glycosyltransferase [Pimelobacter sp. 30-1]|uniref:glycosyltransferase n=1 Tax=Pimelobacter sp. 30-1 TaxID=2004991 RepID=UPI001C04E2CC|nr:glycosyltransferase [Pimelobacter sp. 30-1]MBU2695120.1 hypothetical protein [Pimelobacter sp. 30-1]
MRVLQAPVNIANQAWYQAQGLRALGHEVEVWDYGSAQFDYPSDRRLDMAGGEAACADVVREALAGGFDVVHFHFAQSLVPAVGTLPAYWDLPIWRAMGVPVVMTFHGSDVRLRSHHVADDEWSFYRFADVPCDEELITTRLDVIRRFASHMTVGSVLDLPYADGAVYLPKIIDVAAIEAPPLLTDGRRPVIAHAPSRRALKGTDLILAALDRLRSEGVEFDVDLIEGVGNAEALTRMGRADIVVEKVLGGDIGVTSMEAMALGRVAVTRIRDEVRERHPDLPVVSADPTTLEEVLRDLLADPAHRARIGSESRSYVERVHGIEAGGRRLEELYRTRERPALAGYPGWPLPAPEARATAAERDLHAARAGIQRKDARIKKLRARLSRAAADRDRAREDLRELEARLSDASLADRVRRLVRRA